MLSPGLKGFESKGDFAERFVPGNGLPSTFASLPGPPQGSGNAIRVVKMVQSRNPFGTNPAPTVGVERIPSDMDHLPIFQIS
jgi:hypothetical protein